MDKILISHRGNIFGPNPSRENQPTYINEALKLGYDVEVDVWLLNGIYYLGHDKPEYIVDPEYFLNPKIWTHCKNLPAIDALSLEHDANCFSHDKDDYVLTSKCYIWVHYNSKVKLTNNCIIILPEKVPGWQLNGCAGICSDFVDEYKRKIESGEII